MAARKDYLAPRIGTLQLWTMGFVKMPFCVQLIACLKSTLMALSLEIVNVKTSSYSHLSKVKATRVLPKINC